MWEIGPLRVPGERPAWPRTTTWCIPASHPGTPPRALRGFLLTPRLACGLLPRRTVRILVVEDDDASAQVARSILGHLGHEVSDARTGVEAPWSA